MTTAPKTRGRRSLQRRTASSFLPGHIWDQIEKLPDEVEAGLVIKAENVHAGTYDVGPFPTDTRTRSTCSSGPEEATPAGLPDRDSESTGAVPVTGRADVEACKNVPQDRRLRGSGHFRQRARRLPSDTRRHRLRETFGQSPHAGGAQLPALRHRAHAPRPPPRGCPSRRGSARDDGLRAWIENCTIQGQTWSAVGPVRRPVRQRFGSPARTEITGGAPLGRTVSRPAGRPGSPRGQDSRADRPSRRIRPRRSDESGERVVSERIAGGVRRLGQTVGQEEHPLPGRDRDGERLVERCRGGRPAEGGGPGRRAPRQLSRGEPVEIRQSRVGDLERSVGRIVARRETGRRNRGGELRRSCDSVRQGFRGCPVRRHQRGTTALTEAMMSEAPIPSRDVRDDEAQCPSGQVEDVVEIPGDEAGRQIAGRHAVALRLDRAGRRSRC